MTIIDLNIATPEELPRVLAKAAEQYRESADELSASWQDKSAGAVWSDFAKILERAAEQCARAMQKRGL